MLSYLWHYRWQLGLLPFFAVSVGLALIMDVAGNRIEFATISVLYACADVLMVHYFVTRSPRVRALSQAIAMVIFSAVFFFTFSAYGEAQYLWAQPLFWVAGWRSITEDLASRLYPHFLRRGHLVAYTILATFIAAISYRYDKGIHTAVQFMQFFGVILFGLSLAVRKRAETLSRNWSLIGGLGLWLYTAMCLADVVQKYFERGEIIATPLVAFFAALPVAIIVLREFVSIIARR